VLPLLALLGVLLCAGGDAAAQGRRRRIVVLDFVGPNSGDIWEGVVDLIEEQHTVIEARDYLRVQKQLDLLSPTAGNVARIAVEIGADGVVIGAVKRVRDGYEVLVGLREGRSGQFVRSLRFVVDGPEYSEQIERRVENAILPLIAELAPVRAAPDGATAAPAATGSAVSVSAGEGATRRRRARIVVLDFVGRGEDIREGVVDLLDEAHDIAPVREYVDAQERLGLREPNDANVARIAGELGAAAVIIGSVSRRRGGYEVAIGVRSGQSGKMLQWVRFRVSSPSYSRKVAQRVRRELVPVVNDAAAGLLGGDMAARENAGRRQRQ
jgi:hypothetical protein